MGYCVFLGLLLVSWKDKKRSMVSHSSIEVEYRALASTVCEVQWLLFLLRDLSVKLEGFVVVFCDKKSAIHIVENPVFHEWTKHIDIDCHVMREKLQSEVISLLLVHSHQQLIDCFTKSPAVRHYKTNVGKLNMMNLYGIQLEGDCQDKKSKRTIVCESEQIKLKSGNG